MAVGRDVGLASEVGVFVGLGCTVGLTGAGVDVADGSPAESDWGSGESPGAHETMPIMATTTTPPTRINAE